MHKGNYYKVIIRHKGRLLNSREIQFQLECILAEKTLASESEKNLASLTAWNRTKWAEVREKYFKSGTNKNSLEAVENAMFVLILHDGPFEFDLLNLEKRDLLHVYGKQALTGGANGYWFDKSCCLSVGTNGRVSLGIVNLPRGA
jgi:carnitine O-palmitoyltransferase 1